MVHSSLAISIGALALQAATGVATPLAINTWKTPSNFPKEPIPASHSPGPTLSSNHLYPEAPPAIGRLPPQYPSDAITMAEWEKLLKGRELLEVLTLQKRGSDDQFLELEEKLLNGRDLGYLEGRQFGWIASILGNAGRRIGTQAAKKAAKEGVKEGLDSSNPAATSSASAATPTAPNIGILPFAAKRDFSEATLVNPYEERGSFDAHGQEKRSGDAVDIAELERLLGRELSSVERRAVKSKGEMLDTALQYAPYAIPVALQGFDWIKDHFFSHKDPAPQPTTTAPPQ